ncbi:MAG: tRNA dihydrouridine synthase DusB [Gammaproteobacteria bacterium]|nr:tRNA dihydrouridine synthase DusB [Gammaproteobacteria bacterium]
MKIGPYKLDNPVILAPMAGVTDRPFRNLCYQLGADLCVSEMVTAEKHLWNSRKTKLRLDHKDEKGIRSVQIAGTDPQKLADAALFNVERGAQMIDINMGCPAKKVCNVQAGSALLRNEPLVAEILASVVNAIAVPVTLKIRTGWDETNKNAVNIAKIAEQSGIQALSVHGRTRADAYKGEAEYETIAAVKSAVSIPVIANGDITSPQKAKEVLAFTQADGLMVGRAAQGNPWIFKQIKHFLAEGALLPQPDNNETSKILIEHLQNLYDFYGDLSGVRIARKHIGWYINNLQGADRQGAKSFRQQVNQIDDADTQLELVTDFFNSQGAPLAA